MCCSAKATAAAPAVAIDSLTPSPCRILLLEDHPDSANMMCRLLVHRGFDVVLATNLADAREALRIAPSSFGLLLADLTLPDGSGLDLMRDLSSRPGKLPAIALSGHGRPEDRRASLEAGFVEHMTKPVDLEKLWALLDRTLAVRAA